jgi:hypothetical protein
MGPGNESNGHKVMAWALSIPFQRGVHITYWCARHVVEGYAMGPKIGGKGLDALDCKLVGGRDNRKVSPVGSS